MRNLYNIDEEGLKKLLARKQAYKKEKSELEKSKEARGDSNVVTGHIGEWDYPDCVDVIRRLIILENKIAEINYMLEHSCIIEKQESKDIVDINDIVDVIVTTKGGESEHVQFKLVSIVCDLSTPIACLTIESPIGKAIYGKKVGDMASYAVGNTKYDVTINAIKKDGLEQDSGMGTR